MIIPDRSVLSDIIVEEKKRGKTIVAACGCFEIFHIGHLEYLLGAKALGDILLVGVNSDSYIAEVKKRKPRFALYERMQIIDHVDVVDYTFSFPEHTFDNSLRMFLPTYFVKGIDRVQIIERSTCEQFGIETVRIGKEKRSSATLLRALV